MANGNGKPKVWLNGELVERDEAQVSVFDHGLLYGDGCFEGIRVYGGRIFKVRSHLRRMYNSAQSIRLEPPYPGEAIERAMRETLDANGISDGYIRLVFTRGVGTLGLHPFRCPAPSAFIITDTIELYPPELYENGMHVIVAEHRRVPVVSLDPSIKSLNYLNNILAKIEAIDAEVLEAIMLNTAGYVSECTGDNIFVVKDGQLVTPSPEAGMLRGITRQFVIDELAPALGYTVEQHLFKLDEVFSADEVFLTGTAAEIIGVSKVDDRVIGGGKVGPVTKSLMDAFRQRVSKDAPED
ncbi:MAG: branched-chain-amino-acid transaminase [Planctomycetota bacterium]|jgi:branched-chain amino acid aminotransferase